MPDGPGRSITRCRSVTHAWTISARTTSLLPQAADCECRRGCAGGGRVLVRCRRIRVGQAGSRGEVGEHGVHGRWQLIATRPGNGASQMQHRTDQQGQVDGLLIEIADSAAHPHRRGARRATMAALARTSMSPFSC